MNARARVNFNDLLKRKLDLNKSEFKVYMTILNFDGYISMKKLIFKVGKDRTTLQRTLNNMLAKDLLVKEQINLHKGFMYEYNINTKVSNKALKDINSDLEALQKGLKKYYK